MSATLTLAAALLAAWILGRIARAIGLPSVVGMLAGGLLVGAGFGPWMAGVELPGGALAVESIARPVRLGALALVLLRAGLGLSMGDLRRGGALAFRLGLLPMLGDALAVALAARLLLSLSWPAAMVLGFTVAAISPAIVIPGLLALLERHRGGRRRVLTALLAGAPLDNLVAVVALGVCLDLALGEGGGAAATSTGLALDVLGGLALGVAGGLVAARALRTPTRLAATAAWTMAGLLVWAGDVLGVSLVLAVLSAGMVIAARAPRSLSSLSVGLGRAWGWAQIALFGLVGLSVDLGPLRFAGLALLAVIVAGQLGRLGGSLAATAGSGLSPADRTLAAASYVPKATIQVAFGGLALDRGLAQGELILTAAVLAVVICAPVGATLMRWAAAGQATHPALGAFTLGSRRRRGPGGPPAPR